MHKTTLLRAERAAKGLGKVGRGKEVDSLSLEEAGRILQVREMVSHYGILGDGESIGGKLQSGREG